MGEGVKDEGINDEMSREIEEGLYRGFKYATQELEARRRVDERGLEENQ